MIVSRTRLAIACLAAAALALTAASSALANTAQSANWAGYAVHRSGVKFKKVSGTWKLPAATCAPGSQSFSSTWVGLGGFSGKVNALEQIGSEADCKTSGRMATSVWYELVPAPSHTIRMKVNPGDTISAAATVIGKTATVSLHDLTRHTSYTKTATISAVDVSSADWIEEAPSQCRGPSFCRLLPLANFGTATFTHAQAVTTTGHRGSISDRKWTTTRITLASSGHHFVGSSASASVAQASVSPLESGGRSFTVTYAASTSQPTTQNPPATPPNPTPGVGDLVRHTPKIAQRSSQMSHPALIHALR
jgi:peptidase A4-like protein